MASTSSSAPAASVLQAIGDYLFLITLRHAEEVITASALPKPSGRPASDKEAKMAEQLISSSMRPSTRAPTVMTTNIGCSS